jgi:hypothetical protein
MKVLACLNICCFLNLYLFLVCLHWLHGRGSPADDLGWIASRWGEAQKPFTPMQLGRCPFKPWRPRRARVRQPSIRLLAWWRGAAAAMADSSPHSWRRIYSSVTLETCVCLLQPTPGARGKVSQSRDVHVKQRDPLRLHQGVPCQPFGQGQVCGQLIRLTA